MSFNPESIDVWRSGHQSGTKEAFEWCMKTAVNLAEKARTDEGIKAMLYMVKTVQGELERRYPDTNSSAASES